MHCSLEHIEWLADELVDALSVNAEVFVRDDVPKSGDAGPIDVGLACSRRLGNRLHRFAEHDEPIEGSRRERRPLA